MKKENIWWHRCHKRAARLMACWSVVFVASATMPTNAQVDPDFHIYIAFGQSNTEGQGLIEEQDLIGISPRLLTLSAVDYAQRNRGRGEWYPAVPPLCREDITGADPFFHGMGPLDCFGRTMVENTPENIRIGVICVAVGASRIEGFLKDKAATQTYYDRDCWDVMRFRFSTYDYYAYGHIVNLARRAQQSGVIKGFLIHQGESNYGETDWPQKVKGIYEDLLADLDLNAEEVPLLVGEVVEKGPSVEMNKIIDTLPSVIPTGHVISSAGAAEQPGDEIHFSTAGYREMGRRYAAKMLELEGYDIDNPTYNMQPKGDIETEPTEGNPVDLTHLASLSPSAWSGMTGNYYFYHTGLAAEHYEWNTQTQGIIMQQTIEGLPDGYYDVVLYANSSFTSGRGFDSPITTEGGDDRTFLFANEVEQMIPVVDMGNDLVYDPTTYILKDVPVVNGRLEIGLRRDAEGANWDVIQLRQILRTSEGDLTVYRRQLKDLESRAALYAASEHLPAALIQQLQTTCSEQESLTAQDYMEAIHQLEDALRSATVISRAYRPFKDFMNQARTLCETPSTDVAEGAHDTFAQALQQIQQQADEALDAASVNAATTLLQNAVQTYIAGCSPDADNFYDLTFMLTNPDLSPFSAWNKVDGWFGDASGGNCQMMINSNVIASDGKQCFYEYWNPTPATNVFTAYQNVWLPVGNYRATALAFSRDNAGIEHVNISANDTDGDDIVSDVLAPAEVTFTVTEPQYVKIGLHAAADNTTVWMGIGYMHLYKMPETSPTGIESEANLFTTDSSRFTVYDLAGRRLSTDTVPGDGNIYITDRRKIMNRTK